MRLDLAKNNPVTMVGDGKTPNLYWVTASTDFNYVHGPKGERMMDHAENLMKWKGIKSESHKKYEAVFSSPKEAYEYAEKLSERMPDTPEPGGIHRINVEDRLSGEVYEKVLIAYPRKWGGWEFQTELTANELEDEE